MWSTERLTDSDKILWGRTRIWTQAVWHLHSWAQATQPLISLSTGANLPDAQALSLGFTWIACFLLNWQTNLFSLLFRRFPAFSSCVDNLVSEYWFCFFYFIFFIVVQVQLCPFSSTTFPCPTHSYLPHSVLPLIGFVPVSSILVPWQSFPFVLPLPSPLVTVRLFFISMSLVIFCLLVLLISFHF